MIAGSCTIHAIKCYECDGDVNSDCYKNPKALTEKECKAEFPVCAHVYYTYEDGEAANRITRYLSRSESLF